MTGKYLEKHTGTNSHLFTHLFIPPDVYTLLTLSLLSLHIPDHYDKLVGYSEEYIVNEDLQQHPEQAYPGCFLLSVNKNLTLINDDRLPNAGAGTGWM